MRHIKPGSPTLCPAEHTIKVISGGWKVGIINLLTSRKRRYSELKRKLPGISPRVLARQLRDLERHSIVVRTVHPEVPPRVEYALSATGKSLLPVLRVLFDWGRKHSGAQP